MSLEDSIIEAKAARRIIVRITINLVFMCVSAFGVTYFYDLLDSYNAFNDARIVWFNLASTFLFLGGLAHTIALAIEVYSRYIKNNKHEK